jgi:hypothetical protein
MDRTTIPAMGPSGMIFRPRFGRFLVLLSAITAMMTVFLPLLLGTPVFEDTPGAIIPVSMSWMIFLANFPWFARKNAVRITADTVEGRQQRSSSRIQIKLSQVDQDRSGRYLLGLEIWDKDGRCIVVDRILLSPKDLLKIVDLVGIKPRSEIVFSPQSTSTSGVSSRARCSASPGIDPLPTPTPSRARPAPDRRAASACSSGTPPAATPGP